MAVILVAAVLLQVFTPFPVLNLACRADKRLMCFGRPFDFCGMRLVSPVNQQCGVCHVRFWHKADIAFALHMSAFDPKRTFAKIGLRLRDVWCPLSRDARFLSDQGCPEMQG